jgi:hypothetical protein
MGIQAVEPYQAKLFFLLLFQPCLSDFDVNNKFRKKKKNEKKRKEYLSV